jgi:predicted DNA-binding transcriptional regulator YafY
MRTERLMQLIRILRRARRPVTAARIAEELEVTVRTVYRDIAVLSSNGVPVRGEAGIGYVLGEGFDLPPLMFTADELEALMLGARLVEASGDRSLTAAATDAVTKIGAVIPKSLRPILLDAPLLKPNFGNPRADHIDAGLLRLALREQRKLTIRYCSEKGETTRRTVWPVALGYLEDRRILIAWCELRQGFRHFRTDRMVEALIEPERLPQARARLYKRWREEEWPNYALRASGTMSEAVSVSAK